MTGSTPDENDVRHALNYLVSEEPALGVGVDGAVTQGRRIRRRHRTTRVVLPVTVLALVAVGGAATLALNTTDTTTEPQLTVAAAAMPLTDAGRASIRKTADQITTENGKFLLKAIDSVTPDGVTVDLKEGDIGVPTLDGSVEDAQGAGRLMLSLTNTPGMFTVHPCDDSEFKGDATCTETTLADGSHLTVRGLSDYRGIKTYVVNVTRDDGTGVSAEAGNFTLPPQPKAGETVTDKAKAYAPGGRYAPVVTRDLPVYDTAALAKMVRLVASETSDWPTAPYKAR